MHSRFQVVDYLPVMYVGANLMASQRPKALTGSYDTLLIPFDKYVWSFTFCCTITVFMLLLVMQNIWSYVTGTHNPDGYIFEGSFSPFCGLILI